eukprot:jgi/Psemu1/16558/gm1.16558_g
MPSQALVVLCSTHHSAHQPTTSPALHSASHHLDISVNLVSSVATANPAPPDRGAPRDLYNNKSAA